MYTIRTSSVFYFIVLFSAGKVHAYIRQVVEELQYFLFSQRRHLQSAPDLVPGLVLVVVTAKPRE